MLLLLSLLIHRVGLSLITQYSPSSPAVRDAAVHCVACIHRAASSSFTHNRVPLVLLHSLGQYSPSSPAVRDVCSSCCLQLPLRRRVTHNHAPTFLYLRFSEQYSPSSPAVRYDETLCSLPLTLSMLLLLLFVVGFLFLAPLLFCAPIVFPEFAWYVSAFLSAFLFG